MNALDLTAEIVELGQAVREQESCSINTQRATEEAERDVERRRKGEIIGLGWPTEWPALAKRIGPIEPASLSIVAARPSVGKTLFGLQLARALAADKQRVLFVSRELSVVRLIRRHWVSYGADMYRLRSGNLIDQDITAIGTYRAESEWWDLRYDVQSKTVDEVRKEAALVEPNVIVIDYLQRLSYDTENEYAAITRIVNELQDMTLSTGIPIVCLSQLRRPMPGYEWKSPSMSDTRGSGAVEERAANLILLHRRWETDEEDKKTVAKTQTDDGYFIVGKCADGETGKPIPVNFNGARMRIMEKL